jgi:hypothetical protein
MSILATGATYAQNIASTLANTVSNGFSAVGSLFGRVVNVLPGTQSIRNIASRAFQVFTRPQNLTERSVQVLGAAALVAGVVYAASRFFSQAGASTIADPSASRVGGGSSSSSSSALQQQLATSPSASADASA